MKTKVETVHDQIKDSEKTASGIANRPHRKKYLVKLTNT